MSKAMTREQCKSKIRMSVVVNKDHIKSLKKADEIIDKIFDDFEAQLKKFIEPKTCVTCEHYSCGKQPDNFGWEKCGWDWECKRKYEDHYEPKD